MFWPVLAVERALPAASIDSGYSGHLAATPGLVLCLLPRQQPGHTGTDRQLEGAVAAFT